MPFLLLPFLLSMFLLIISNSLSALFIIFFLYSSTTSCKHVGHLSNPIILFFNIWSSLFLYSSALIFVITSIYSFCNSFVLYFFQQFFFIFSVFSQFYCFIFNFFFFLF